MTFRVTLSETAARQLRKLPSDQRNRVIRGVRVLEEDPFRPRPPSGYPTDRRYRSKKYRIRIGDYRAVYAVLGRDVKILELFTRGRGYR